MTTVPYRELFDLTDKIAIVTGAGRGIGRAIAEGFGAWGARVVIAVIDPRTGTEAADAIRDAGGEATAVRTDVTDTASIVVLCEATERAYGMADILVNNAGMSQRTPAEEYSDTDLERIVALNLTGLYRCMREVARRWARFLPSGWLDRWAHLLEPWRKRDARDEGSKDGG